MKIAVRILAGIFGALAALWIGGLFLPDRFDMVDVSLTLDASPAPLLAIFDSHQGQRRMWLDAWRKSNREGDADVPPMNIVNLGDIESGPGTRIGFYPDGSRLGTIAGTVSSLVRGVGVIEASEPGTVVMRIDFGIIGTVRRLRLDPDGDHRTRVRWTETLALDSPLARYLPVMLSKDINDAFAGLLRSAETIARDRLPE